MTDYYLKLKDLLSKKKEIKEVQIRARELREE